MQVTEVRIYPTKEKMVKAYATIVFDNCLMIREIKVIKSTMGLFVSFPAKKQRDGSYRDLAFPANAKTRRMIQQAILAEYETIVAESRSPLLDLLTEQIPHIKLREFGELAPLKLLAVSKRRCLVS